MDDVDAISELLSRINEIFTAYYELIPKTDSLIQDKQANEPKKE